MTDHEIHTLSNGIRIVHKRVENTQIVHCGIFLDIGSRDESAENQGIAHFWEHMAFKGTRKRKSYHILNRIDSVGGELNAFTDKEKIVFHASVRQNYFENAFELLADITFDSVFPSNQIEKERNVILEEMAMYHDDPDDSLYDEFDQVVFSKHPLGRNILGTPDTVRSFKRKDFKSFIRKHINTSKVVFSSVGSMDMDTVVRLAEKYLAPVPKLKSQAKRSKFKNYRPNELDIYRDVQQARCAMGRSAYHLHHSNRIPFYMLVNMLGGPYMNSRLSLSLREKKGLVYSIEASYTPFTDTGLFGIYFGTEPSNIEKSIALVKKELQMVIDKPLGTKQLAAVKEQFKGQLALMEEHYNGLMIMMGRSLLDMNRITLIKQVEQKVLDTSAQQLHEIAADMFNPDKLSVLRMLPSNA
jgi:predicted Zn-dependent peptidase